MYDAWLGEHIDYCDPDEPPDEWVESAENEPDVVERIIAGDMNAFMHNLDLCIAETEADGEWGQALIDGEDEQC
jgi:hypothetical protein